MKNKIIDHQSLLLEKQRLQLVCAAQEKEIGENFIQLKEKLDPKIIVKEAILDFIPNEIRESKIVSFISSMLTAKGEEKASFGNSFLNLAKTTILTSALNYIDKFLTKK